MKDRVQMRYIALEEAFSVPELEDRHPSPWLGFRFSQRHITDWARKLPDFTEYRLPEMDAAGIDIQVLSLTVPGLQSDIDAPAATDLARAANARPRCRSGRTPPLRPRPRFSRRAGQRPSAGLLPRRAAVRRGVGGA